jgi:hypothetical protein
LTKEDEGIGRREKGSRTMRKAGGRRRKKE